MFIDMLKLNLKNIYLLKLGLIFGFILLSVFFDTGFSTKCEFIPHINDGYHVVVRTGDGRIQVNYDCYYGLIRFGPENITCSKNGDWEQKIMPWCGINIKGNKQLSIYYDADKTHARKSWLYTVIDNDITSCFWFYAERYIEVDLNDKYTVRRVQVIYRSNSKYESHAKFVLESRRYNENNTDVLCINGSDINIYKPEGSTDSILERTCHYDVENVFYIRFYLSPDKTPGVYIYLCEVNIYGPPTKEYPIEYCKLINQAQNARFVARGRCFYLFLQEMSQKTANDFCQFHGLNLATIDTTYTSYFVGSTINYILNSTEIKNKYFWVNTASYYTHCKVIYQMEFNRKSPKELEPVCTKDTAGVLCEANNIFCGSPGVRFNQNSHCYGSANLIDVGSNITIQCTAGTKLNRGKPWRKCQEGAQWTESPICE